MHIVAETLDDILIELYPKLLAKSDVVKASRGDTTELLGVQVEITDPRARLSRSETRGKAFSSLGELLWYLSKENRLDFIERYVPAYREESEDGKTVHGGYGPRIFDQRGINQLQNVMQLLKNRPSSRRAVIQLFNAEDIASVFKEIPCTTTLQFLVRDSKLELLVTMRSNDAYLGLPHDVFCFSMLQEIVATTLGLPLGSYRHFAASMHMYTKHHVKAQEFINEGFQSRVSMPSMPAGNPWVSIGSILKAEEIIRNGGKLDASAIGVDPYWADLIRILQIHFSGDPTEIRSLSDGMSFARYRPYILSRLPS